MGMNHRQSLRVALVLPVMAAIFLSDRALAMSIGNPVAAIYAAFKSGGTARTAQGYLGVDIRDVSEDEVAPLKLKDARGAEIIHVDHDAPAGKLGLQKQDVILKLNDQQIENQEQLRKMLRECPAGLSVTLVISRDGRQQTMKTQLANRQEVERRAWEQHLVVPDPAAGDARAAHGWSSFLRSDPSANSGTRGHRDSSGKMDVLDPSYTGARLEVMGPQLAEFFGVEGDAGLLVRSVETHSPAEEAGIRAGDVVLRVNQVAVTSGNDWAKIVRQNRGKPVSIVVLRNRHEQTMTMTPDGKKRSCIDPQGFHPESFGTAGVNQVLAVMAELKSVLTAMETSVQQRFAAMSKPVELVKMTEQTFTPRAETQRHIRMLHKASGMVAEAAWKKLDVSDRVMDLANQWMGHPLTVHGSTCNS
jgi:membrane-associated protease RseP (regulator of RpoE activity)